ncbi:uncharacterized protein [Venturia canescens]|uniref:uncharacterized protein isoform X3 n=1 Tax=Venturia canescens TaxID=32260 RepID=UPI001C9D2234|nr:uncharacterized protein LOC122406186 isoform X3 [Venturia canescens]
MPIVCVVPGCKTGSRVETAKHSLFCVPKDPERRKQWENAIPGIVKLSSSDRVCAKHFNSADICHEWKKQDENGQIIARVQYKRPRLSNTAVPIEFNCQWSGDKMGMETMSKSTKEVHMTQSHSVLASNATDDVDLENLAPNSADGCINVVNTSLPTSDIKIAGIDSPSSVVTTSLSISEPITGTAQSFINLEADMELSHSVTESLTICSKTLEIRKSAGSIPSLVNSKVDMNSSTRMSGLVSDPWSFRRVLIGGGYRMVFSYTTLILRDSIRPYPVTQKHVTLDEDGTLYYFVYGIPVNSEKLDKVLNKKEELPDILRKFKNMNVCNGIGDVNKQLMLTNGGYSDAGMKWRSKDCPVISIKKRCDSCMISRKNILQRTKRLNNPSNIRRIKGALNVVDQGKILAMRLKMKRENRRKIQAQNRLKIMLGCLKEQKARIASVE